MNLARRITLIAVTIGGKSELARRIGRPSAAVRRWTGRKAPTPGADVLAEMVQATKCNGHWLLTGEGDAFPTADAKGDDARTAIERANWLVRRLEHAEEMRSGYAAELATVLARLGGDGARRARMAADAERESGDGSSGKKRP